jgi:hypothetical protein
MGERMPGSLIKERVREIQTEKETLPLPQEREREQKRGRGGWTGRGRGADAHGKVWILLQTLGRSVCWCKSASVRKS